MIDDLIYQLDSDIRAHNIKTARAILDELRSFHRPFLDNLANIIVGEAPNAKSQNLDPNFLVLMTAVIHERLAEQEGLTRQEFDELARDAMDTILRTCCKGWFDLDWTSWEEVEKYVNMLIGFKLGHGEFSQNGDVSKSLKLAAGECIIAVGTPEWDTLTGRRAELIHKKNRKGLNDDERTEYERLQQISRTALARAFPQPKILSEANTSDVEELLGSTEDRTDQ
jgi:hypothetical protein